MATTRILYLAANPVDLDSLAVDEEARLIDRALQTSRYREGFDLRRESWARPADLLPLLNRWQPQIVHFSGHGGTGGLYLLGDDGRSRLVDAAAVEELARAFGTSIRLVVLNACLSAEQAAGITRHVACAVGMSAEIGDASALKFAEQFYSALGYGDDVATAFAKGKLGLRLEGLPDGAVPQLRTRTGIDAARLVFAGSGDGDRGPGVGRPGPEPERGGLSRRAWMWFRANARFGLVPMGAGLVLLAYSWACGWDAPLDRYSFDLPLRQRVPMTLTNVLILTIPDELLSGKGLDGRREELRRRHAQVLARLNEQRPRLVFFDQFFRDATAADAELAAQFAAHGRVVIGARAAAPIDDLRRTVGYEYSEARLATNASWGFLNVDYSGDGKIVRRLPAALASPPWKADAPTAVWVAAQLLVGNEAGGSASLRGGMARERWLRYYGTASGTFPVQRYDDVLELNESLPRDLTNRIVFIGAHREVTRVGEADDTAEHPGGGFVPGVHVHATAVLNLVRNEWLRRGSTAGQVLAVAAWGLLVGAGLGSRPTGRRLVAVLAGTALLAAGSTLAYWWLDTWWTWLIPVALQTPLAVGCAVWRRSARPRPPRPVRGEPSGSG